MSPFESRVIKSNRPLFCSLARRQALEYAAASSFLIPIPVYLEHFFFVCRVEDERTVVVLHEVI